MTIVYDICEFYRKTVTADEEECFFRKLFVHFFLLLELDPSRKSDDDQQDDLLFFIHQFESQKSELPSKPQIQVLRRNWNDPTLLSRLSSPIDWKDTLFLNLVVQKFHYTVQLATMTRTGPEHMQTVSKQRIRVFATPSHHSVLNKEIQERYSYPMMNFHLDNYEEFLYDNLVNYLDVVYIELLAHGSHDDGQEPFVIMSFCIDYDSIDAAYIEKRSIINGQYLSVAKIVDHRKTGAQTELVIKKKIKRSVSDNRSEKLFMFPATSSADTENVDRRWHHRPHSSAYALEVSSFFLNHLGNPSFPTRSNHHRPVTFESLDLISELNDPESHQLWRQPGFSQWYFRWKRKKKATLNSYHCCTTTISVPCGWMVEQVLRPVDRRQRSLLSI